MSEMVLIVEDDEETRNCLARALRMDGLVVLTAQGGQEGLELIRRHRPAVVLLDLVMPDISGEVVCAAVRADPEIAQIYILMLTGLSADEDRVAGFELGADDYVTKPFNMREIILRVRAAMRRSDQTLPPPPEEGQLVIGALRIERRGSRVFIGERECGLTPSEHALLVAMAERPGRPLTRRQLADAVGVREMASHPRCVDAHVKRLRQKLGTAGRALETVRGAGYRLSDIT
jgi:two-component system phosphate regulon response regulator PhoB